MMENNPSAEHSVIVSPAPHVRDQSSTFRIMLDVLLALLPAAVAAVWHFGFRSLAMMAISVASCVLFEFLFEKICHRDVTVGDLSAAVTGLILAFNLPLMEWKDMWQIVVGALVAIVIVKQLFGGIGRNFANPAVVGRIVLFISFSSTMTRFTTDTFTGATPLASPEGTYSYLDLFLGNHGGCLGETCSAAILLGCVYLLCRRVISWHAPVAYVGTVALLSFVGGKDVLLEVLSGGLLFAAVFMATDYVTTPLTKWGKFVFGVFCGLITVLIRFWGNYPEGVSFAILLGNIVTPYINMLVRRRPFGKAPKDTGKKVAK